MTLKANYDDYTTTQIVVGSGGLLTASGTAFNSAVNYGGAAQLLVDSGGHLEASNSSFALSQLNLNNGVIVNAGDFAGNAFNLPLYIPAIDMQYLSGTGSNNLQFQAIYIQPDTLTSGQSVALNLIGTQNTSNLSYVFPGNFTINQGATLAVGPNVPVVLGLRLLSNSGTVTVADNGTLTFAAGDTVTLDANYDDYTTTQIVVGSGGLLTASGTTINSAAAYGGVAQIVVNSGGHLQASNKQQFSSALSELNLNSGAVLNAGDLVGNAFNCPLYIPAMEVQYLSGTGNNNLQFQAIYIQSGTLTSGQSVALNAIGTQTTTNLSYVFSGTFTINQGATLAVGANVPVALGPAMTNSGTVTVADNGTLTFAAGDTVTLNANYDDYTTTQIVVGSGGLLTASGTAFNSAVNYGGAAQLLVNSGGHLEASNNSSFCPQPTESAGEQRRHRQRGRLSLGNAFNLPLYIPAIDMQYLSGTGNNNLQFQAIYIQPDTLTSGQSVALNLIGTQNTSNLRYVFPGNFTINQGASLAVGANVRWW